MPQFKHIYAPFNGIITKRNIDIGTLIYGTVNGPPQALFEIAQSHTMRFFVEVPQTYFTEIQNDIEAIVTVLELPEKIFSGRVTRFAKALDPQARTMSTQVDVENLEGFLYPGLHGRVKFLMEPPKNSFIIPASSIIIRSSFPQVAIVDANNIVHMHTVQIGHDHGNKMEITSGLKEDDRIVAIANDRIREGVKVEVIQK